MNYATLSLMTYGMYILTTKDGDKDNAMLLSIANQVSSEPVMLSVSISKKNLSCETIQKTGKFNISVASENAKVDFLGGFGFASGKDTDKLAGVKGIRGDNDLFIVTENCLAYYECEVAGSFDCGNDVVFIAKVANAGILSVEKPMTLAHYQQVLNGTVSEKSPAYAARYTK